MAAAPTPEQLQQLLNGPSSPPPPGVEPNFTNPSNLRHWFIITTVLCLFFSTLAVSMRMYTKLYIIRKTEWSDYISVLGWLMTGAYFGLTGKMIYLGGGVHMWNIQLKHLSPSYYYMHVMSLAYGFNVSIVKLSIILQYLSIFVPHRKANLVFIGCHLVIWSHFIFYTVATFFEIFICSPRRKFWSPLMAGGHCYNVVALDIYTATFNALSDFVILLLPQHIIWRLQMRKEKKLGVSAIFLTGLFACLVSIMRLYYAIRVQVTQDITYESGCMGLWTLAEFATTTICGCMPTLPKFCQTIGPKLYSSSSNSMSLTFLWKGSKLSRAFAKQSVTASFSRPALDMRGIKSQPQGKYSSLEELELGSPSGSGSRMSGAFENLSGQPPSLSAGTTSA